MSTIAHSDSDGETTQMIIDDTSHSPSSEYQAYNHATGVALTWSSELGHNDIDAGLLHNIITMCSPRLTSGITADNSIDIGGLIYLLMYIYPRTDYTPGTESEETHTAADGTVPFGDPDSYSMLLSLICLYSVSSHPYIFHHATEHGVMYIGLTNITDSISRCTQRGSV
jgi:hypothetical protein